MAAPLVIEVNHVDKIYEPRREIDRRADRPSSHGQTILLNTRAAYRTGMRLAIRIVVKGG